MASKPVDENLPVKRRICQVKFLYQHLDGELQTNLSMEVEESLEIDVSLSKHVYLSPVEATRSLLVDSHCL